ncbi:MAG: hypothetical protein MJZ06_00785 [Bacteroidaceae bacterium]|nr:hypothetical protein [Bacteroidaceae bacterium]
MTKTPYSVTIGFLKWFTTIALDEMVYRPPPSLTVMLRTGRQHSDWKAAFGGTEPPQQDGVAGNGTGHRGVTGKA